MWVATELFCPQGLWNSVGTYFVTAAKESRLYITSPFARSHMAMRGTLSVTFSQMADSTERFMCRIELLKGSVVYICGAALGHTVARVTMGMQRRLLLISTAATTAPSQHRTFRTPNWQQRPTGHRQQANGARVPCFLPSPCRSLRSPSGSRRSFSEFNPSRRGRPLPCGKSWLGRNGSPLRHTHRTENRTGLRQCGRDQSLSLQTRRQ